MGIYLAILVAMLSSPDWSVRELGSNLLDASPKFIAVALSQSDDLEVKYRAVKSLDSRRIEAIRRLIDANRPLPWIDALPPEWPSRKEIIDEFLGQTGSMSWTWDNHPGWPRYRWAMELYLYTLPLSEVKQVLSVCPRDKYWNGTWISWVPGIPEEVVRPEDD